MYRWGVEIDVKVESQSRRKDLKKISKAEKKTEQDKQPAVMEPSEPHCWLVAMRAPPWSQRGLAMT